MVVRSFKRTSTPTWFHNYGLSQSLHYKHFMYTWVMNLRFFCFYFLQKSLLTVSFNCMTGHRKNCEDNTENFHPLNTQLSTLMFYIYVTSI